MFLAMQDLRPATREDLRYALSYGLRFAPQESRTVTPWRTWRASRADVLIDHLERSGFVVMKKPDLKAHGAPGGWQAK